MINALRNLKDWAPLPARLALGAIFVAHGSQKLFGAFGGRGFEATQQMMGQMGLQPAPLWAVLLVVAEFFGGLGLLFGLLTRLSAVGIVVVMIVAVATVHGKHGFFLQNQGYEYNLALIGLAISLLFSGAGKFSIESLWSKPQQPA